MKISENKKIISLHDFARTWNSFLSKVCHGADGKIPPATIISFNQPCKKVEKWLFVMKRLNSNKDFCNKQLFVISE